MQLIVKEKSISSLLQIRVYFISLNILNDEMQIELNKLNFPVNIFFDVNRNNYCIK